MYILKVYSIYTAHWDKTQILKKFPSGKKNGTKNALFFFRELQLISFTLREKCRNTEFFLVRLFPHLDWMWRDTFNLRFLYRLMLKVRLSKTVCGIFHFRFHFVFTKVYIFVQQNDFDFKIPFKIKIIEKSHTVLLPHFRFLSYNNEF